MVRPAYSLRSRLLAWLLVPLLLIAAIALVDTYREAVGTANAVSDRVLAGSALAIAERVIVSDTGELEVDIPYVALEMLTSAAQDRVFYRIEGPPGRFVTGYQELPTLPSLAGQDIAFADADFRGEPIRLAVLERSASTGLVSIPFSVTVAETTIARSQLTQTLILRSALRLAVLVLSAAIIVWFAVTASLAPLYRLRNAIARRTPDDLSPIEDTVPKEVRGLVDTVNSFMTRLGGALDGLKHFTGNASHQLRTPLAIVRTQLALAGRAETLADARSAAAIGDAAVANAERVLAQLLLLARIDQATSDRVVFPLVDLTGLARDLTADHVLRAHAAGIDLGFDGAAPVFVAADALLLGELLGNLIENALAYAGAGAEVTVRVLQSADGALLEVEDNGPGIPEAARPAARQRFARGAPAEKPGAGLGLPIVEEIATLFGASLQLGEGGAKSGLRVRIVFPA